MAWTSPLVFVSGTILTAAQMNTYVSGNTAELRAGGIAIASQAAGDIHYSSSSSQFGRVAGAAVGAVLGSGGTGSAPAWSRVPAVDGVTFPAVQVPSAGVNVLDDYEEGSWTPVIGGAGGTSGQTYVTQVGRYVKIGLLVTAQFRAALSAKGTITGAVQIQGLPFTAENVSGLVSIAALRYNTLATNWADVNARVLANTTTADVEAASGAVVSNTSGLATADIANGTILEGTIIYRATA